MDKKEIKKHLDEGHIKAVVLFEVVGNPAEHVKKTIRMVTNAVKAEKGIILLSEEYGDPEDAGEGLFGTYCEAEVLVKSLDKLGWIALNFAPASIEVLEPSQLKFSDKEMTHFFADVVSHLHQINMRQVEINNLNKALQHNINAIVRNAVLVSMTKKDMTAEEIGSPIGIKGEDLQAVLEAMVKEGTVSSKDGKYSKVVRNV